MVSQITSLARSCANYVIVLLHCIKSLAQHELCSYTAYLCAKNVTFAESVGWLLIVYFLKSVQGYLLLWIVIFSLCLSSIIGLVLSNITSKITVYQPRFDQLDYRGGNLSGSFSTKNLQVGIKIVNLISYFEKLCLQPCLCNITYQTFM